jgi:ATP-dependent DNA ligase
MPKKRALPKQGAHFIETMDCLPVPRLPEGPEWTYEIKLDGYRLEAVRGASETTLYSRRQNILNHRFHFIATALGDLPHDTVIDGELVALAPDGRPDFNLLQNFRSGESRIIDFRQDQAPGDTEVPVCEPSGADRRQMGPGSHSREDEGVRLGPS